jgi:hypothetical protein
VLALSARSDGEEFIEGQDARFAATVALLALVENRHASCWCVSGFAVVGVEMGRVLTDDGSCTALRDQKKICRSHGGHTWRPWWCCWAVMAVLMLLFCSVFGRNGGDKCVSGTKHERRHQGGVKWQNASLSKRRRRYLLETSSSPHIDHQDESISHSSPAMESPSYLVCSTKLLAVY